MSEPLKCPVCGIGMKTARGMDSDRNGDMVDTFFVWHVCSVNNDGINVSFPYRYTEPAAINAARRLLDKMKGR